VYIEIEYISLEAARRFLEQKRAAKKWKQVIAEIKKTGKPAIIPNLTKGQIAYLVRAFKREGFEVHALYGEGKVVVIPK